MKSEEQSAAMRRYLEMNALCRAFAGPVPDAIEAQAFEAFCELDEDEHDLLTEEANGELLKAVEDRMFRTPAKVLRDQRRAELLEGLRKQRADEASPEGSAARMTADILERIRFGTAEQRLGLAMLRRERPSVPQGPASRTAARGVAHWITRRGPQLWPWPKRPSYGSGTADFERYEAAVNESEAKCVALAVAALDAALAACEAIDAPHAGLDALRRVADGRDNGFVRDAVRRLGRLEPDEAAHVLRMIGLVEKDGPDLGIEAALCELDGGDHAAYRRILRAMPQGFGPEGFDVRAAAEVAAIVARVHLRTRLANILSTLSEEAGKDAEAAARHVAVER